MGAIQRVCLVHDRDHCWNHVRLSPSDARSSRQDLPHLVRLIDAK